MKNLFEKSKIEPFIQVLYNNKIVFITKDFEFEIGGGEYETIIGESPRFWNITSLLNLEVFSKTGLDNIIKNEEKVKVIMVTHNYDGFRDYITKNNNDDFCQLEGYGYLTMNDDGTLKINGDGPLIETKKEKLESNNEWYLRFKDTL